MRHHRPHLLSALALAGACAWAGVSWATQVPLTGTDDRVTVLGTLTCSLIGDTSPAGRDVLCEFQPGQQGPVETYVGSTQAIGQSKLLFGTGAVILAVKGPASTHLMSGLLQQRYAVDTAGSGHGLAPLVGERNKQITLQPLVEEEGRVANGKSQAEAVLMVMELELQASPA